jgi:hypothetical protein
MITCRPIKKFTMNLPDLTHKKLETAAKILQMSKSDCIRKCIDRELDYLVAETVAADRRRKEMLPV